MELFSSFSLLNREGIEKLPKNAILSPDKLLNGFEVLRFLSWRKSSIERSEGL